MKTEPAVPDTLANEKIQKVLARHGHGSRRYIEGLIEQKRIKLNGKLAKLGERISDTDIISIDGKVIPLQTQQTTRVLLYNKPLGEVCTREQKGISSKEQIKTVFNSLPKLKNERWISIGRLDINTSGLLLFTTDGELAHRLMHPSTVTDREYSVRLFGEVDEKLVKKLKTGVILDDGLSQFSDVVINNEVNTSHEDKLASGYRNHWLTVCLQSGKNREVRRLLESQKLQVNRLKRVRYATIYLPAWLQKGKWIDLDAKDVATLYDHCKLPCPKVYQLTPNEKRIAQRQLKKMKTKE